MVDKNKALTEYISTYPKNYGWLFFNVINIEAGSSSLLTDSDNLLFKSVTGVEKREYVFSIAMMKNFDTGTSDTNIDAMAETQFFSEWIKLQNKIKNFPLWNDFDIIESIEVLTTVPILSVDSEQNVARYILQLKIAYNNESEVIE